MAEKISGLTPEEMSNISSRIRNLQGLNNVGIRFIDAKSGSVNNYIKPINDPLVWVCIKIESNDKHAIGLENSEKREITSRPGKVISSVYDTALSCGSAIFMGVAAAAGAVPTGGLSVVVFSAGALASATSCGINAGRLLNEVSDFSWMNPENNQILDESKAFKFVEKSLEVTADISSLYSIGNSCKQLVNLAKKANKTPLEVFKRSTELTNKERKEIARELYVKKEGLSKKQVKKLHSDLVKSDPSKNKIATDFFLNKRNEIVKSVIDFLASKTGPPYKAVIYYVTED